MLPRLYTWLYALVSSCHFFDRRKESSAHHAEIQMDDPLEGQHLAYSVEKLFFQGAKNNLSPLGDIYFNGCRG